MKKLTAREAYYIVNKKTILKKRKEYYENNKERELKVNDIYYQAHKSEIKEWRKAYMKAYNAKRNKAKAKAKAIQAEKDNNQLTNQSMTTEQTQQAILNEIKKLNDTFNAIAQIGNEGDQNNTSTK